MLQLSPVPCKPAHREVFAQLDSPFSRAEVRAEPPTRRHRWPARDRRSKLIWRSTRLSRYPVRRARSRCEPAPSDDIHPLKAPLKEAVPARPLRCAPGQPPTSPAIQTTSTPACCESQGCAPSPWSWQSWTPPSSASPSAPSGRNLRRPKPSSPGPWPATHWRWPPWSRWPAGPPTVSAPSGSSWAQCWRSR